MQGLFLKSLVILCSVALAANASIDSAAPLTEGVGVVEHLGDKIDTGLTFKDQDGNDVVLSDLLSQGKPVVLAPVYYTCPGMCTLVLNGLLELINDMSLDLGDDYIVINVSFDTRNTPELARQKAENYYKILDSNEQARKWYFLTGSPENVDQLMSEIGFHYKPVEDQFSHASVLVLLEQNGTINRYVYGVTYPAKDVRLALIEASQGKIGSPFDQFLIYCFRYDPKAGKYVPMARNIMKAGGLATIIIMTLVGFFLWKKELPQLRRQ